jgi:hypothetical protein
MLYMAIFDAKEDATLEDINRERDEWINKGRSKAFEVMCKSIERYEVAGMSPLRIFFLIDTDDPQALNKISHHFGDYWDSVTYPVIHRELYDAMEDDRTIIGG